MATRFHISLLAAFGIGTLDIDKSSQPSYFFVFAERSHIVAWACPLKFDLSFCRLGFFSIQVQHTFSVTTVNKLNNSSLRQSKYSWAFLLSSQKFSSNLSISSPTFLRLSVGQNLFTLITNDYIYSYFEKGCRKKAQNYTRQSRKVVWDIINILLINELIPRLQVPREYLLVFRNVLHALTSSGILTHSGMKMWSSSAVLNRIAFGDMQSICH